MLVGQKLWTAGWKAAPASGAETGLTGKLAPRYTGFTSLPSGRRSHVLEDAVYAVVRTGGKQYRVEEGRAIKIERLPGEAGDTVELGDVLLMADGDNLTVGAPVIEGARVVGTIAEQGRSKKILVFHFKNKTRHRKKNGHRQHFTRLVVSDILTAGQDPKPKPEPKPQADPEPAAAMKSRARKKAEVAAVDAAAEISAEAETPAETETPAEKPKRSRKKTTE